MRKEQIANYSKADDRALLVLVREAAKAQRASERVFAVVEAMALRRGVIDPTEVAEG